MYILVKFQFNSCNNVCPWLFFRLNHPVKRFRPDEETNSNKLGYDLYAGHQQQQLQREQQQSLLSSSSSLSSSSILSATGALLSSQNPAMNPSILSSGGGTVGVNPLCADRKVDNGPNSGGSGRGVADGFDMMSPADIDFQVESPLLQSHEIKKECGEGAAGDDDNKDNLFTDKGLRPSYDDLDRLFNENDNSNYDMVRLLFIVLLLEIISQIIFFYKNWDLIS